LVAIVAVAVVVLVVGRTVVRDDDACAALGEQVAGLEGFGWDNGVTSSGPEWLSVLTDGTTEADAPSRQQIAAAVAADEAGYERFRSALPDDLEPAADRLHEVALDPAADRADGSVERDAAALRAHGTRACNFV